MYKNIKIVVDPFYFQTGLATALLDGKLPLQSTIGRSRCEQFVKRPSSIFCTNKYFRGSPIGILIAKKMCKLCQTYKLFNICEIVQDVQNVPNVQDVPNVQPTPWCWPQNLQCGPAAPPYDQWKLPTSSERSSSPWSLPYLSTPPPYTCPKEERPN